MVIFHSPLHSSDSFNLPPFSFSSRAFLKIFYFRLSLNFSLKSEPAFVKLDSFNLESRLSRRRRCQRQVRIYPKKQKPQGANSKFFGKSFLFEFFRRFRVKDWRRSPFSTSANHFISFTFPKLPQFFNLSITWVSDFVQIWPVRLIFPKQKAFHVPAESRNRPPAPLRRPGARRRRPARRSSTSKSRPVSQILP